MKFLFKATLQLFTLLVISAATSIYKKPVILPILEAENMMSCGASLSAFKINDNGKFISVLPGWGHYNYSISSKSDSAKIYFNQGLNFYYSYHFREALASFKEASRFDANSAMAYWGQALAMGPYYNDYYYKMRKEVPGVIELMTSLSVNIPIKEHDLIHAMQQRYSADTTNSDRRQLDSNYAVAMHHLTKKYADDNDIKVLYVDAVMLSHKWDFWNNDGTPKAWTPALVKVCEGVIKNNPSHPAALHYYIHLTEASRTPTLALHSADVLKEVMPGVGHMVHMSTHMYQRNGLFAKGVFVNEDANDVNNKVDSLASNLGIGKNTQLHIYAVQSYCAMHAGMYEKGMPIYLRARNRIFELRGSIDKETYSQYVYMLPVLAWARLGKWQQILESPPPDPGWKYARVLDDFARGIAHVHNKNLEAAKKCLTDLRQNLNDSLLAIRNMPFNSPLQAGEIGAGILEAELLFANGQKNEAIAAFKQAIEKEDKLVYREPNDWIIPTRQYLGAYLLRMNNAGAAEKIYREDLMRNPANGWSLIGMYNSLRAQKRNSEAVKFKKQSIEAFRYADVHPTSSVF